MKRPMSNQLLGRLTQVAPRDVWPDEARHFTPWLSQPENLGLLGKVIGLELELEAVEQDVGPFRADILCRDVATNEMVLVENQLARTDHRHLGQVITYAAGLQAATIIWIANPFTEEHRAALDWLNSITAEGFHFFGLEVELWRIGASPPAPKFNAVVRPNDWTREVQRRGTGKVSELKEIQRCFWEAFVVFLGDRNSPLRPSSALPQAFLSFALGRSGFRLIAVASSWNSMKETYDPNEVRASVILDGPEARSHFELLRKGRALIEEELGFHLEWVDPEDAMRCRIEVCCDAQLEHRDTWPTLHSWLASHLEAMSEVFEKRIREL
ncbi:MAG: DUF4268 domain-containing protein [Longimicrobiales bacterium]